MQHLVKPGVACLAVIAVVSGILHPGCSKKPQPAPQPDCVDFQKRAETCQPRILELIRQNIEQKSSSPAAGDGDLQYKMFESRFTKKVQQEYGRKQCERFRDSESEEKRKKYRHMLGCCTVNGCDAFAACILGFNLPDAK